MAVSARNWLDANVTWRGFSESPAEFNGQETAWSMWNWRERCFEIIVTDRHEERLVRMRFPIW
ncbi:MAG: hypothetical protein EOO77_12115 [Oxalobacteraceae bacterium]|nr:MAG: hypothetical protein EOO77_12115 [Oxalobacteraceae bacterium]